MTINSLQAYIEISNDENQISKVDFGVGESRTVGFSNVAIVQNVVTESPIEALAATRPGSSGNSVRS
jgi:hypothetical protein